MLDQPKQSLICRLHAAAATTMLFDLPGEIFVNDSEMGQLRELTDPDLKPLSPIPKPLLTLDSPRDRSAKAPAEQCCTVANANWLDAIKYPVNVWPLQRVTSTR